MHGIPSADRRQRAGARPTNRASASPADGKADPVTPSPEIPPSLPQDDGLPYDEFDESPQNMARLPRHEREEWERIEKEEYFDEVRRCWRDYAKRLANWASELLINRTDVWGRYRPIGKRGDNGRNKAFTMPWREGRGSRSLHQDERRPK